MADEEEEQVNGKEKQQNQSETEGLAMENGTAALSRKEKRKALRKMKRKQIRRHVAIKAREEEEARLNDPQEQLNIELMEREEAERSERERKLFEEREKAWLEAMEMRKKKLIEEEEEEQRRKALDEELRRQQAENATDGDADDDWEYVEEGPAEIIWQGNEIIVKKKKVRVPKKNADKQIRNEDGDRPTSNPLPPQSETFADYKSGLVSAQHAIETVAQQVPNFGTEQDKAHCPFHLKTGACRFGQRCSRVHFYPDKACTILIKNMYNGPGLAWEQDEGLEYTDEEVERCYEEFYEDVHTEFLKFGEIINFKVCRNGSFHLRGNVYVQYKCLDSAMLAYHSINGRYFAGKQVICEFVNLTRWKVAICGEYMKSKYKTCSHGTACNFIHCFRNPGGDYEWADGDKPPPKYWVQKMAALFGYSDDSVYERQKSQENFGQLKSSSKLSSAEADRYHSRRSRSREIYSVNHSSSCRRNDEHHDSTTKKSRWQIRNWRNRSLEGDSEVGRSDVDEDRDRNHDHAKRSSENRRIARYLDDYGDHDYKNDKVDKHSDKGKRDSFHDKHRKSSRNSKKVEYPDSHGDKKNTNHHHEEDWSDMDRDDDADRHRKKRSKSSVHSSKVSKLSDERGDIKDGCGTDFSDDEMDKGRERHHSHTGVFLNDVSDISEDQGEPSRRMKKIDKAGSSKEYLRPDRSQEPGSFDRYDVRDRSYDLEFRHNSLVTFDNQDRWESEQYSGDMYYDNGREKLYDFDSENYYHDKLDREDSWDYEEVASKRSSKLHSSNKRTTKSDKVRRSKSSSQSSHSRCFDKGRDSSENNKPK